MTLIWFTLGVRATLRASVAIGLHASNREAPNARYVSTLSLLSLHINDSVLSIHTRMNGGESIDRTWTAGMYWIWGNGTAFEGRDSTHWISRSTVVTLTTTPLIVAPQSIPKIGIYVSGAQNFYLPSQIGSRGARRGWSIPPSQARRLETVRTPLHHVAPHWEVPYGTRRAGRMRQSLAVHSKRVVHSPCQKISVLIC
jgi:hypothetical protein